MYTIIMLEIWMTLGQIFVLEIDLIIPAVLESTVLSSAVCTLHVRDDDIRTQRKVLSYRQ